MAIHAIFADMNKLLCTTFLFAMLSHGLFAQLHDNAYRNSSNTYYWQNRIPDKAYWQQDVAYHIYAIMVEDSNMIDGAEVLSYWNNSPDTLNEVYFHLYQNAFVNGSYLHELEKTNHVKPHPGIMEAAGLGTITKGVQVDGETAKTITDNTIMKVLLPRPLRPGGQISVKMTFKTYYDNGATRRRMQMYNAWGFTHYNGVQWFPKLCVYDRMHGWDTYQHLNKEFYGDFGLYDVVLDFPSNYIVEATGVLQNRESVLPDSLRRKLELKNFANKKWNEPPSVITPYRRNERKQWHFVANNVHDFAFTADPTYRIGTAYENGVECVALVQEPHAAGWQNATNYIAKIIRTFSEDIGAYCYPKIVAADAQDGMEYPMLTLDGGSEPGYRGLFVHEIGHNWFYGQVGSNETYRAAMDEGFTQFLTAWGLRRIDGENSVTGTPRSWLSRKFNEPRNVLDNNVLTPYTMDALSGNETAINTHSDDFNSGLNHGGGYREVYFKTASMLYNLQYVLGDSLFQATLHHYFEQWKFAHPYFEDFRASVTQFTHQDLSWFFDEWFETTKTLDYRIGKIRRLRGDDSFAICFKRKGEMQMPLDFTVTAKDGRTYSFYIPNTWWQKENSATLLPKWYGWGKLNPEYTAMVQIPGGISSVQIDTTARLADKNMTDNIRNRMPWPFNKSLEVKADPGFYPSSADRRHYRLAWRPDLWWNGVDGVKAGVHFDGNYLYHLFNLEGAVWLNTHLGQQQQYKVTGSTQTWANYFPVNYSISYNTPISTNLPKLRVQISSRYLDGLWAHSGGLNWTLNDRNIFRFSAKTIWRGQQQETEYLPDRLDWSSFSGNVNSSALAEWIHSYGYINGSGRITGTIRTPLLTNNYNYSYAQVEVVNTKTLGKLDILTRLFGRYGMGTTLPAESALYMSGASPEDEMENKFTRSIGFIPSDWTGISTYDVNHFQMGGGLNLRGYAGYFAPDTRGAAGQLQGYRGRSGVSASAEIGFDRIFRWTPNFFRNWLHVNLYGFGDAGFIEMSTYAPGLASNNAPAPGYWSSLHTDAGLGMAFTVKKWGFFNKAKPLTLRLDLPVFLNRTPYGNTDYFAMRYVVGINRAF